MFLINLNEYDIGWKEKEAKNVDFTIRIPKSYAREESTDHVNVKDLDKVDCYELYVTKQSYMVTKDKNIYFKLPKSGTMIAIVLRGDGTVDFNPRLLALRELDKLDRDILLGFCCKYFHSLMNVCNEDSTYTDRNWILLYASNFKRSDVNKRINNHSTRMYYDGYEDERKAYNMDRLKESMIDEYKNIQFA